MVEAPETLLGGQSMVIIEGGTAESGGIRAQNGKLALL